MAGRLPSVEQPRAARGDADDLEAPQPAPAPLPRTRPARPRARRATRAAAAAAAVLLAIAGVRLAQAREERAQRAERTELAQVAAAGQREQAAADLARDRAAGQAPASVTGALAATSPGLPALWGPARSGDGAAGGALDVQREALLGPAAPPSDGAGAGDQHLAYRVVDPVAAGAADDPCLAPPVDLADQRRSAAGAGPLTFCTTTGSGDPASARRSAGAGAPAGTAVPVGGLREVVLVHQRRSVAVAAWTTGSGEPLLDAGQLAAVAGALLASGSRS